jgi:hypothetical protein
VHHFQYLKNVDADFKNAITDNASIFQQLAYRGPGMAKDD